MPPSRLLVLTAGNFFVATSFLSVNGLLPEIAADLHVSVERANLLIAAFGISAAICAPTLATIGTRIERRYLLAGSMAVCALANVLAAFSHSYNELMLARVLAAVTSAVYTPQVAATVSLLVPESERPPTLAKLMIGWAVGSVAGNPLSVLISTGFGWRASFIFIGAASALIACLIWYSVPAKVYVPPLTIHRWIQVFRSPALRWLTAATALTNVGGNVLFSLLAPVAKETRGIVGTWLAALYSVTGVGGLIGNLISIRLVRKIGAAGVAYKCNLSAAVMLFLWPFAALWTGTLFLAQFLLSMGNAGFPGVQQARLVSVAPTLASATIALNSSVTYLGGAVGAVIASLAWPRLPPRFMPWVGLMFVIAALACSVRGERAAAQETERG